ncbi:predicted protein [Chaetoceros tenuissimus]|uniref:Uncharacterized protein n=1 Tax=Chaetoceros tenuissimus TaxID=426638 RepID=A0AAD3D299_9STRA|nr:predicted protein [Chaetoceros tenuissimus]
MKFLSVLLAVAGVFSPAVHSQKVDDKLLVSSAVAGQNRQLNVEPCCKKFNFDPASGHQFFPGSRDQFTGPKNYFADDGNGGTISLRAWCDSLVDNPCCTGGTIFDGKECSGWSENPLVDYHVCKGSCNGSIACSGIAEEADDYSSITLSKNSCSDSIGNGQSCDAMAAETTKKLNLIVHESACTNERSCAFMALGSKNLEELTVGKFSCTEQTACFSTALNSYYITALVIESNQCNVANACAAECVNFSKHTGGLQLTTECCQSVDETCEGLSESPSVSSVPSYSPSVSHMPSVSSIPSDSPTFIPTSLPSESPSRLTSSTAIFPTLIAVFLPLTLIMMLDGI